MHCTVSVQTDCPACGKQAGYTIEVHSGRSTTYCNAKLFDCPHCHIKLVFHLLAMADCYVVRIWPADTY